MMPTIKNAMNKRQISNPGAGASKQQGAALLISLILIFVLTLLGLTTMRTSSLETRMVTNVFEKEITLQGAESASELALADDQVLAGTICKTEPSEVPSTQLERDGLTSTNSSVTYGGETVAVGYSLDSGFAMMRFTSTGTSTLDVSGTATRVTQGIFILGAKGGNGGC